MTPQQIEDIEQAAYLRGWNDRPGCGAMFFTVIGMIAGMSLALIGVVG
jgi:tetrahydromethanopterin S-methyltransferase subunit F